MKINEVIEKIKDLKIGTILKCKQLNTLYELEEIGISKKYFKRKHKGDQRFSSLIYEDYDFEIVKDEINFNENGITFNFSNGFTVSSTNQSIIQIPELILDDEERLIGQQHTYKTRVLDRIMIKRINDLVSEVNELRRRKINE